MHARHAHAQVTRKTHHTRCTSSRFSQVASRVLSPPRSVRHAYVAGDARPISSVSTSPCPRPSWSVDLRDVSWERALLALPDQLLSALRAAELGEPGFLCEYTRVDTEELYGKLGEMLGENVAPSSIIGSPLCISSCISSCLLCSARVQGT